MHTVHECAEKHLVRYVKWCDHGKHYGVKSWTW